MIDHRTPDAAPTALPAHLYVHVPLCRSRCPYCDFYSTVDDGPAAGLEIAAGIRAAAAAWTSAGMRHCGLETVYVGGGTPTMLRDELPGLVRDLRNTFAVREDAEITVEANPDSLNAGLLASLADAGVTRVSVGVQSLDDGVLGLLGRSHTAGDALGAMRAVVHADLDLAVDLMCGIPGSDERTWHRTVQKVRESAASHVSVYPLTLSDATPMGRAVSAGEMPALDDDAAAEAMLSAEALLQSAGYVRYETANYALPGHESRHNLAYWTGRPYLGIGRGAHGMLARDQAVASGLLSGDDVGTARVRYAGSRAPTSGAMQGVIGDSADLIELLTADEAAREDAMLGLRLTAGITDALACRAGVQTALASLVTLGLVERAEDRWRTTARGWLLGNEVFARVWQSDSA